MLYVPANRSRMITKAQSELEDAVILDLEDAVPIEEKGTGRILARDSVSMFKDSGIGVFVRVNAFGTGLMEEDIGHMVVQGLDGVVLAKAEERDHITKLDQLLVKEEKEKGLVPNGVAIMPLVESPKGVQNVFDIASASSRIVALAFGAGDFLREMGVGFAITRLSPEDYYPMLLYARSRIAQAAKVTGIEAIDTPFLGILTDTTGLGKESDNAKMLGFTGKQLIHPLHIETVNKVFAPSEEDLEYAQSVVAAYQTARAQGAGAASFGGRMIDYAVHRMGMDMISRAAEIAKMQATREKKGS